MRAKHRHTLGKTNVMRHRPMRLINLLLFLTRNHGWRWHIGRGLRRPRCFGGRSPHSAQSCRWIGGGQPVHQTRRTVLDAEVPELTQGRVQAEIHPFDRSGLPGQEMLQLMRLGVVPFGTALLALVSGDEPELNAVDLPTLNPDMPTLKRTVELYREQLHNTLQEKYGIELLGIYAYPAQVLYCAKSFNTLTDLAGRKVRTSSVGQSEMMAALGAIPIVTPFSEIVNAIKTDVVDCAITGTMSGGEIGLPDVTSYISPLSISWGLSFFGANKLAWDQLPPDIRADLRGGIHKLELSIWDAADRETAVGLACDVGSSECADGENLPHETRADHGRGRSTAQTTADQEHSAEMDPTLRQ